MTEDEHQADAQRLQCGDARRDESSADTPPLNTGWAGMMNPMFLAMYAKFGAGFFGLGCIGGLIFLLAMDVITSSYDDLGPLLKEGGGWGLILFAIYFTLGYLLKHNKFPSKGNTLFDRPTGLVHLPLRKGRVWRVRFDELEPYLHETVSPNGVPYYHLLFAHRYSDGFMTSPEQHMSVWQVYLEWEHYRQYMDISKPLPDLPVYEPERKLDPTTIAWDKRMNRPERFWGKMPGEAFSDLASESIDAGKAFPWGSSREQAIASGWQPSRYGRQTWWDREPPKAKPEEKQTPELKVVENPGQA